MGKKLAIGTVAVFVAWQILDYIIHGQLLMDAYVATSHLWRPQAEMKMGLMMFVTLVAAGVFTYIYTAMISNKSMNTALKYGALFGLAVGISMGYGTYAVQPITYNIALTWFLGTIVETTVAGALLGLLVKD